MSGTVARRSSGSGKVSAVLSFAVAWLALLGGGGSARADLVADTSHDPGLKDITGTFAQELAEHGAEKMWNDRPMPNEGQIPDQGPYGAPNPPKVIDEYQAYYALADRKRTLALIVEDMTIGYTPYAGFIVPNVQKLLSKFREQDLMVVWTNWARRAGDNLYGALDRYYGPQGATDERAQNPMYMFPQNDPTAIETIAELAPKTPLEHSRTIQSFHLNKFLDLGADGKSMMDKLLREAGVDTILITGTWTEDCIASTAFDAADGFGYDVVMVTDAVATATPEHLPALQVMGGTTSLLQTTDEVLQFLEEKPDLVRKPLAPPVAAASSASVSTAVELREKATAEEESGASMMVVSLPLAGAAMGGAVLVGLAMGAALTVAAMRFKLFKLWPSLAHPRMESPLLQVAGEPGLPA